MADFLYSRSIHFKFNGYVAFISLDSCDDVVGGNQLRVNLMVQLKNNLNSSEDEEEDCDEDLLENREK